VISLLSQLLPGGTDENREKSQSGHPVLGPRFESRRSRIASHSVATFSDGAHNLNGETRNAYRILRGNVLENGHLEDREKDGKIMVNLFFE
jgi:hypothetical protein